MRGCVGEAVLGLEPRTFGEDKGQVWLVEADSDEEWCRVATVALLAQALERQDRVIRRLRVLQRVLPSHALRHGLPAVLLCARARSLGALGLEVGLTPRVYAVIASGAQRAIPSTRRMARMEDLAHADGVVTGLLEVLRKRRPITGDGAEV